MLARSLGGVAVAVGLSAAAAAQAPLPGTTVQPRSGYYPAAAAQPAPSPPSQLGRPTPVAGGQAAARPVQQLAVPMAMPATTSQMGAPQADAGPATAPGPGRPFAPQPVRADVPAPQAAPPARPNPFLAAPYAPTASDLGTAQAVAPCGPDLCPAEPCGPPGRVWVGFEWLYWTTTGQRVPPLVTTAPAGTAAAVAGVLGQPTTTVLAGGNKLNDDWRSGFRATAGLWLNGEHTVGLQGDFLYLGTSRQRADASSPGDSVVTRPFTNALTGQPDASPVSFPGVLAGSVLVDAKTDVIGGGVAGLVNLCCDPCGRRYDLAVGYRYLGVRDSLTVRDDLTALAGAGVAPGTRFLTQDRFKVSNNFHGATVGVQGEQRFSSFFVGGNASVGLGVNYRTTAVEGRTTTVPPGNTVAGGLLTQPSNIGSYSDTKFAVMPELGLKVGAMLTDTARVYVGYNVLYLSDVGRAGDQIDTRVNPNLLPPRAVGGPALPAFSPRSTDFWMHGLTAGFELRF